MVKKVFFVASFEKQGVGKTSFVIIIIIIIIIIIVIIIIIISKVSNLFEDSLKKKRNSAKFPVQIVFGIFLLFLFNILKNSGVFFIKAFTCGSLIINNAIADISFDISYVFPFLRSALPSTSFLIEKSRY